MEYTTVVDQEPSWSRDTYQSNHRRVLTGEEVIEFAGGTELKCPSIQVGDARWIHWTFLKNSVDEYILKLQEKCLSQDFKDCVICMIVSNKIIDVTFFSDANEVVACLLFDDGYMMSINFSQISSDKSIFANYINDGNAFTINDLADKRILNYSININTQQKQIKKVYFLSKTEVILGLSTGEIMQINIDINSDDVGYSTVMFGKIMQKLFNVIIGNPGKIDIIDMAVYGGQYLFVLYTSGNIQLWDIKTKSLLSENSLSHHGKILNGKIRMNGLLDSLYVAIGINYESNSEVFFCTCANSNIETIKKIHLNVAVSNIQDLFYYVLDLNFMPKSNGIEVIYRFESDDYVKYHRASCIFESSNELSLNECMKEETYIVDREIEETDTDTIVRAIMRPNRFRRNDIIKVMRRYAEIPENIFSINDIIQNLYEIDKRYHCNILIDLERLEQFNNGFYHLLPLSTTDMTIVLCNDETVGVSHTQNIYYNTNDSEMQAFVDSTKNLIFSDNLCSQQLDRIKYGTFVALNETYDTSTLIEMLKLEVLAFCRNFIDNNYNGTDSFKLSNILTILSGKSDYQIIQYFDELLENCLGNIPKSIIPVLSCFSCNITSGIMKKVFGQNIDNSFIVAILFTYIYINGGLNSDVKAILHARYLPTSICHIAKSSLILWLDTIRPCSRIHDTLKYINTIDICPSSVLCPDIQNVKVLPNFSVLVNFCRNTTIVDGIEDDLDYLFAAYLMKSGEFPCLIRLLTLLEYQNLELRSGNNKFTSLKLFVQMIDRVCYYHAEHSVVDDSSNKLLESIKYISNKLITSAPKHNVNTNSKWFSDTKARVEKTTTRDFNLRGYDEAYGDKIMNIAHLNNLLETSKRIRVLLTSETGSEIALNSCYAMLNAVIELLPLVQDTQLQTFLNQELHQTWFHIFEISLDGNLFDEAYTAIIEVLKLKDGRYTQTCIDCISSLVTKVCDYGYLGWLCKISIPSWDGQAESLDVYSEIINALRQLSDDIFTNNSMSNSARSKQLLYYECLCCFLLYRQRFYDVHRTLYPLIKDYFVNYDYNNAENIFNDREKVEGILNTISIIIHSVRVVPPNHAFIVDNMKIITYENLVQVFQQFLSINSVLSHSTSKLSIKSDEDIVIMLCAQNSLTQALNFCHHIKNLDSAGVEKIGIAGFKYKTVLDVIESYYHIILDKIIANPTDHEKFNDLKLGGTCTTAVTRMGESKTSINILMDLLCYIDTTPALSLHQYACNKTIDMYNSIPLPLLDSFWKNSIHTKNVSDVALLTKLSGDVALLVKLLLDRGSITTANEVMSQFLEEVTAILEQTTYHKCEILIPNTIIDRLLNMSPSSGEKIKMLLKKYYTILSNKFR